MQAWYYNVKKVAQAYWLQFDLNFEGVLAGAQYTGATYDKGLVYDNNVSNALTDDTDSNAYAVMLGYEMKDVFTLKASYSQVDKAFNAGFNTATSYDAAQSKLYTEAWWNYGYVTRADTSAYNVTIESPVNKMFDLGIYYTHADQKSANKPDVKLDEVTLTAGKKFGSLDTTIAYIYANADDQNKASAYNTVQAYLTLNF